MLFVGDWDGNMYQYHYASQESRSYRFDDFVYEGRTVPNGIYAICLDASGSVFVGLSSGHIAVGRKGDFRMFHLHNKPVRGLRSTSQPGCCVSCGNDGRVLLFNSVDRSELELQSVYMDREYIFGIDVSPDKNFVVYAGTGAVAECVDLRTNNIVWQLPLEVDCWSISVNQGMDKICFGMANGSVVVVSMDKDFMPCFDFASFEAKKVVYAQDHFAGDARNRLPLQLLKDKYSFENLGSLH